MWLRCSGAEIEAEHGKSEARLVSKGRSAREQASFFGKSSSRKSPPGAAAGLEAAAV
jgi:hypothetical protein